MISNNVCKEEESVRRMDQLWNRVISPCMKWMTTQYPFGRQPAAPEAAVSVNRFNRIGGTAGIKPAVLASQR